jgi:hypothetical protein
VTGRKWYRSRHYDFGPREGNIDGVNQHSEAQMIAPCNRWGRTTRGRCGGPVGSREPYFVAKYGGMSVSEAQEVKRLREENARLKKLLAELTLRVT